MEHELVKHALKIFRMTKEKQYSFSNRIKEIAIEIFIIVFAVTLSIKLHAWSEQAHQQQEANEFLADLRDDLQKDLTSINTQKTNLEEIVKEYNILKNITKEQVDSLERVHGRLNMTMIKIIRKTNDGNYEGFKSSGKIGYIKDKKLKKQILKYYQEGVPSIEDIELLLNAQTAKTLDIVSQDDFSKRSFLKNSVKQRVTYIVGVSNGLLKAYEDMATQAHLIIKEIDKQIR